MTVLYGPCLDGPYRGRSLAHARPAYRVTYERDRPNKTIPCMVESTSPWVAVGAYVFHPLTESWHWFAAINAAPISPTAYALWITEPPETSQIARDVSR